MFTSCHGRGRLSATSFKLLKHWELHAPDFYTAKGARCTRIVTACHGWVRVSVTTDKRLRHWGLRALTAALRRLLVAGRTVHPHGHCLPRPGAPLSHKLQAA